MVHRVLKGLAARPLPNLALGEGTNELPPGAVRVDIVVVAFLGHEAGAAIGDSAVAETQKSAALYVSMRTRICP